MRQCRGFLALQRFRRSLVNLFRFFTSFVSFSVFRLSFSSFCFPSVECGYVASLPGLGLIVFVKVVMRMCLQRRTRRLSDSEQLSRLANTSLISRTIWIRPKPRLEVRPLHLGVQSFQPDAAPPSTMAICPWKPAAPDFVPCGFMFVSFSVFRLSFSSFCFPSVDCGCMASLPGLGLLFL